MRLFLSCLADRRGTAAIEFALLVPVVLLLLCGMLAYGLYFGALHSLQQLAADAARTAVAGLDAPEQSRLVSQYLDRHGDAYILLDAPALSARLLDADPAQIGVELRYDATTLPIWNLYLPLPLPSRQMVARATIRRGGL